MLLEIKDLRVRYSTERGIVKAIDGLYFRMEKGETVGLIGESGSGKSSLGFSILRLLPPNGKIISGEIIFKGKDLLKLSEKEMLKIRGKSISMVFQDPMTSLNPLMKIGDHLIETILIHEKMSKEEAKEKAISLLEKVGIPPDRFNYYPHQFSGGMRQRIMIALALALDPDLVIADEPVTALDVITQAKIIDLLKDLKRQYNMGLIFITHDISVVAEIADKIALMYAGNIVEFADAASIFEEPLHPYTKMLLEAIPNIELEEQKLKYIPGTPPDLVSPPSGCRFHPRCPYAKEICKKEEPKLKNLNGRMIKCHRY
ncbi:MAG: ABC transporter ATP-binding protein [Candidatus Hydrothermarchaeota archaeon]|nr:MAG: ABC transporter ATP-binding protein [Candidatus Hydrothermarchaeota archaeon]